MKKKSVLGILLFYSGKANQCICKGWQGYYVNELDTEFTLEGSQFIDRLFIGKVKHFRMNPLQHWLLLWQILT